MIDKIGGLFAVSVLAAMLWSSNVPAQKILNRTDSEDYWVRCNSPLAYLFGVRPRWEKIYLRPAYFQVISLLFFAAGFFGVCFFGHEALIHVWKGLGIGMFAYIPIWIVEAAVKYVRRF